MRKTLLTLCLFNVLLLTQAFSQPTLSQSEITFPKILGHAIAKYLEYHDAPGAAVAVYDGRKGYVMSFGYANQNKKTIVTGETIFEIGSITKVFTGTNLALKVLQNHVHLGDSITLFFPPLRDVQGPIKNITLLDLATHFSSLPRDPPPLPNGQKYTYHQILAFMSRWKPAHQIGSNFLYSNLGFGVLGYALGNLSGQTYDEIIANDITKPLGMNSTMVDVPGYLLKNYAQGIRHDGSLVAVNSLKSPLPGGGALRSTANDMLTFLQANLLLKGSSTLLNAMQLAQKGYTKANERFTMGLGWQRTDIKGYLVIDKNGGVPGFTSYIGLIPEKKVGIVILANRGKANNTTLGRLLLHRLANLADIR